MFATCPVRNIPIGGSRWPACLLFDALLSILIEFSLLV
jgi:hypothetical protein